MYVSVRVCVCVCECVCVCVACNTMQMYFALNYRLLTGVFIRWNGMVEWNGGMERWNGIVEWWNTGTVE